MLDDVGTRERVAQLLHQAGALAGVMKVRRFAPVPTLAIVTYHHIADQGESYRFDPDVADAMPTQFRRQMETLARHCTVVTIDDVVRAVEGGSLPANPVLVSFDDGYRSCHDVALQILNSVGLPATFFIATGYITDRKLYWWERIAIVLNQTRQHSAKITYPETRTISPHDPATRRQLTDLIKRTPNLDVARFLDELTVALGVAWSREIEKQYADELIMTWDHVRAMAKAGMGIESHTRHHRVLQTLDDAALDEELGGSKRDIERELGRPCRAVAYPVGRTIAAEPRIRAAIERAGYSVGFTNATGTNTMWPSSLRGYLPIDRLDIRRLSTDRLMSDAMFFTQVAIPPLAYTR